MISSSSCFHKETRGHARFNYIYIALYAHNNYGVLWIDMKLSKYFVAKKQSRFEKLKGHFVAKKQSRFEKLKDRVRTI
jgi:hypothetical protein